MITIINYKMGNLQSVQNAFDYLGFKSEIVNKPEQILNASKILLPGVGSFNQAMKNIHEMDLFEPICEMALNKKIPVLGICLGMQLLTKSSDENGFNQGFGFIDGEVSKFKLNKNYRVPHVGFNSVKINAANATLFKDIDDNSDFYFVHSYRLNNSTKNFVSGITEYGEKFIAAFEQNNIFGAQFHPEKSQSNGLKMLVNFAQL